MFKTMLPTISWLLVNTLLYGSYHFFNLGIKINRLSQKNPNLNQLQFFQSNFLLKLYLFSTAVILIIGIFNTRRRHRKRKEEYAQKKSKQRRNYTAH